MVVNRRAPRQVEDSLRVVAFNAKGGRHLDSVRRCLARPPLAGANVILLCDADWNHPRSGFKKVAADLAAALELSFAFAPKHRDEPGSYSGNAILCSQPLLGVVAVSLSKPHCASAMLGKVGEPHGLLAAAVFKGRLINLGVAHLTARWNPAGRKRQMADFITAAPANGPILIGGDFNTTTIDLSRPNTLLQGLGEVISKPGRFRYPELYEPLLRHLEETGFEVQAFNALRKPTFTFARAIPTVLRPKLDWLAARQLSPVPGSASVVAARRSVFGRRFSDHDFIMCEVKL